MKIALIVSTLVTSLALDAQTLQGKVVRVADGDTITRLDEGKVEYKIRLNRIDAPNEGLAFGDVGMIYLTPYGSSGYHNVDTIL
jgi:endonuclease YncB( thermonuclease family)